MFLTNGFSAPKRVGARRRHCLVFVFAILLLLGSAASVAGDVIRTLNGQPMTTLDRLRSALKSLRSGAPVALQIQREQKLLFVSFVMN